jgi:hypothetical protein
MKIVALSVVRRSFLGCCLHDDDTCLVASDASGLMRRLDVLVEWCREWGVTINVAKSGIMHIEIGRWKGVT